jgi:3-hydroxyisobutyrate dehydrogenase-like beta-hydroxyacid dehydrogenase
VELPVTTAVHKLFAELLDSGGGELDHTGLITVLERLANHEARTKA